MTHPHERRLIGLRPGLRLIAVLAALALIAGATWLAAYRADGELRADLLQQARLVAMSINMQGMAQPNRAESGVGSSDYQRVKAQLALIRHANPRCRFLYLMSRRPDGVIEFLVDSEPIESKDYSPPGQTYDEAPSELHRVFVGGYDTVKGPYADRWGSWISAFIPLPGANARGARTVLGMDIDAAGWRWDVASRAALPAVLAAIVVLLGLLTARLYRTDRDIRDRDAAHRRSEDAIQKERANLQTVLNASPVGMLVFDEHEAIMFANPAAEGMFANPLGDLMGRKCGDFLRCFNRTATAGGCGASPSCHACELSAAIRAVLLGAPDATAQQGEVMIHVQTASEPLWLSFKVSAAVMSDRRCAVVALDSITERKRAEEQVRTLLVDSNHARLALLGILEDEMRAEADRKRLATAIEQAAEIIVVTDAAGRIQYGNPAFEAVTGYTRSETVGQTSRILKSDVQDAEFYRDLWTTISSGRTWQGRLVNRKKDGTHYTEEATISPVHDATGTIINYVAVKRDLTDHLKMQAQLLQAQKLEAIGTLAGGVAHEINNPIMGVMGYAQLIVDRIGPDDPVAGFATEIMHETERVAMIVKNLLSFARQDGDTHGSPARMCDIVGGTLSLVRTVLRHDQVKLEVAVSDDLPRVKCRSQQIQQVLMNLLTNARDALNQKYPQHDPNKLVRIEAQQREHGGSQWIRLTVEDRGAGIPEGLRERIFDPFFTTKPRDKGTGLGLSISHGIAKDHAGALTVESEVGQWTRFHLDLPVDPGGPPDA